MEDVNLLLSYIETEIMHGKKSILGNGVIVDGEAILNLVRRVRASVAALNGDDLREEAAEIARNTIAAAEQRRAQLLEERIINAEVKVRAEQKEKDVEASIARKKQEYREYVAELLNNARKILIDTEGDLEDAINKLTGGK